MFAQGRARLLNLRANCLTAEPEPRDPYSHLAGCKPRCQKGK